MGNVFWAKFHEQQHFLNQQIYHWTFMRRVSLWNPTTHSRRKAVKAPQGGWELCAERWLTIIKFNYKILVSALSLWQRKPSVPYLSCLCDMMLDVQQSVRSVVHWLYVEWLIWMVMQPTRTMRPFQMADAASGANTAPSRCLQTPQDANTAHLYTLS